VSRFLRKRRVLVILGFALLVLAFTQSRYFYDFVLVQRLDWRALDFRFEERGALPPNPKIALVGIKASSLNPNTFEKYVPESDTLRIMAENSWPWPRAIFARAVDKLFQAGAKVVAIDIVFAAQRPGDDELAAILKKYRGRVILASVVQPRVSDAVGNLTENESVFLTPNREFTEAAGPENVGFAKYTPDQDDVKRRFDFRTSMMREFRPEFSDEPDDLISFAPLAVARFNGTEPGQGRHHLINYAGPWLTYQTIPIEELFIDSIWKTSPQIRNGEGFRDKLVFIGPIAEVLHDVHTTPFSANTPGVDIHAQLAGNLLEGRLLNDAPRWVSFSVALLCTLLAAAVVLFISHPVTQVLALAAIATVDWFLLQLLFTRALILVPTMPGFACLGLTGSFGIVFLFVIERWEKARTRRVLERSINKRIAEVVMQNAEEFEHARRGERRTVTILFSDIRGFTSLAEQIEPENLVGQLNEYFESMVDIIEREESFGNAHAFIGDAILAAWGDTPKNSFGDMEDARRAVTAALRMRAELKNLNATWDARPDRTVIKIGIGVNVGNVVVGQVGHPERQSYTMLGDGVNFAARLETGTKQFHTDILVGESVEALTRNDFVYRHADFVCVKGKTKPVNVFIPLSGKSTPPPEWLEDYHRARQLFLDRKFLEAGDLFRALPARIGGEDFLCSLYRDLCDRYSLTPPPESWNGSRELTEK